MTKRLCKSTKNKMLFGVCGGIAEYFKFDATVVRIVFAAVALIPWFRGIGFLAYIICAIVMPKPDFSDEHSDEDIENMKSANMDNEDTSDSSANSKSSEEKKNKSEGRSDKDFNSYF
ncbi:MAG: PspC domain-containing protein [Spirochaetales bacterium]|nr:PspC domain-containing protein [Spirochaetales bacterium]